MGESDLLLQGGWEFQLMEGLHFQYLKGPREIDLLVVGGLDLVYQLLYDFIML